VPCTATEAPRPARWAAVTRLMPREEPVTQATFPFNGGSIFFKETPLAGFRPKVIQDGCFVNLPRPEERTTGEKPGHEERKFS